jgi:hypothetical protein
MYLERIKFFFLEMIPNGPEVAGENNGPGLSRVMFHALRC